MVPLESPKESNRLLFREALPVFQLIDDDFADKRGFVHEASEVMILPSLPECAGETHIRNPFIEIEFVLAWVTAD